MTELKPCPFCGSEEIEILSSLKGFVAVCPNCECVERFGYKKTSAAEAWNQRSNGWVKIEDIPEEWKDGRPLWLFWYANYSETDKPRAFLNGYYGADKWITNSPGNTNLQPTHAMLPTPPEDIGQ